MKYGKAEGQSRLILEMVKSVDKAGLTYQMLIEGVSPVKWELITIINCYKGQGHASIRGNYRELKITR